MFEIIENLKRKPTDRKTLKDKITNSSKYFVKTDKQVNFRGAVLPELTITKKSPYIK